MRPYIQNRNSKPENRADARESTTHSHFYTFSQKACFSFRAEAGLHSKNMF